MNYRFISTAQRISKADTSAAVLVTNIDEIIEGNEKIGEYVFNEDAELTNKLNKADKISIVRSVSTLGIVSYRADVTTGDRTCRCRLYGAGKGATYAERELTKDEVKSAIFGFCKSGGEIVTELKFDGVAKRVPVIYLKTTK